MARPSAAKQIEMENEEAAFARFQALLADVKDPRRAQGRRYPLSSVLVTALLAMVCGADDAMAIERWSAKNEDWLSTFLALPQGTPGQDVYLSVFAALEPSSLQGVLRAWADVVAVKLKGMPHHIAVDGKTSRRSGDAAQGVAPIHTVSAWLSEQGLVLASQQTEQKSNEIKAIPELLKTICLKGATITIDAMGCQTEIAKTIVDGGGHYLLAVKDNQPHLHAEIRETFAAIDAAAASDAPRPLDERAPPAFTLDKSIDKAHGRIEERTVRVCHDLRYLIDSQERWPGLCALIEVTRQRTSVRSGSSSTETAYYIASNLSAECSETARLIRGHWGIENSLHWVLDMAFREDEARHRAKNCAKNMATMRQFTLNLIKNTPNRTLGVKNTRLEAGWSRGTLVAILTSTRMERPQRGQARTTPGR